MPIHIPPRHPQPAPAPAPARPNPSNPGAGAAGQAAPAAAPSDTGLDLETLMMQVQSKRTELLEKTMKDQLDAVAARNKQIGKLNDVIAVLRTVAAAASTKKDNEGAGATQAQVNSVAGLLREAGVSATGKQDGGAFSTGYTKAEVNALIENVKGSMDTLNSSQQMDMLRLQGLSNKRNEAFDLMSNFVKKMADGRSSIIGNMR